MTCNTVKRYAGYEAHNSGLQKGKLEIFSRLKNLNSTAAVWRKIVASLTKKLISVFPAQILIANVQSKTKTQKLKILKNVKSSGNAIAPNGGKNLRSQARN